MANVSLKINHQGFKTVLKGAEAQAVTLEMATLARDAANRWARSYPRSGKHRADTKEPFAVVTEPGRNRARYTVRPSTPFATWLVQHDPGGFIACLEQARR